MLAWFADYSNQILIYFKTRVNLAALFLRANEINLKRVVLIICCVLAQSWVHAQKLQLHNLEISFLTHNYWLLVQKYNIDKARAEVIQEKLYPNPTFSLQEINFWSNKTAEQLPTIIGKWGNTQQISAELEQLIETAQKRRKRVAVKKVDEEIAVLEFEELTRVLRKDLRQHWHDLQSALRQIQYLEQSVEIYNQLLEQYKRQAELKNVSQVDYLRVKTEWSLLKMKELEVRTEMSELLTQLKVLSGISDLSVEQIALDEQKEWNHSQQLPINLVELAWVENAGLQLQSAEVRKAEKVLVLEKANKRPDVNVQVNYDRGGGIMRNFVGFGMSMDLPFWNRNKGNIQAARIGIEQEEALTQMMQVELEHEVNRLISNLTHYEELLETWFEDEQEVYAQMLENHRKHLQAQRITLMEFIDFTSSYLENQQALSEMIEGYFKIYEELRYVSGVEF